MGQINTVKIAAGDGGYLVINETDFDPIEHTLFEDHEAAVAPERMLGDAVNETAGLMKHTKAELVAIAEGKGLTIVPDEMTKAQIVEAIEAADATGE